MKDVLVTTLKLFIICAIAAALLGVVYQVTEEPIATQQLEAANAARMEALPDAVDFEEFDAEAIKADENFAIVDEVYIGKDASGEDVGATVKVTTKGFAAGLELTIGISNDGTVTGMRVNSHGETAGLGANATKPEFYAQFNGMAADGSLAVTKDGGEVVSLTGATITSRAVTDAINVAANCYSQYVADAA